jgi:hypothetical protein
MKYFLYMLLLVQGVSAVFGGSQLVIRPDGSLLNLSLESLERTPFGSYFFPGLILLLVLGILPLVVLYGLIKKPKWRIFEYLNLYQDQLWAWSFSVYTGFGLIIWIIAELFLLKTFHGIQLIYAFLGIAIVVAALFPSVRSDYNKGSNQASNL